MRSSSTVLVGAALCAGLVACNPFEPRACTLIGCDDMLVVELQGGLPEDFTFTAESEGEEPRVRHCSASTPCGSTIHFEDFTPGTVKLTYQSAARFIERTFSPEYAVSRPNGPGCPPECRQGTVQFPIS